MKRNLRKGIVYFIGIINGLIILTAGNNDILTDNILVLVFAFNTIMLLKYDHKYLIRGDEIDEE